MSFLLVNPDHSIAQDVCFYPQIVQEYFEFKPIVFGNTISVIENEQQITKGDNIGTVAPYPETFSNSFDQEINDSKTLYSQGQYLLAYQVLEEARKNEPHNTFILNESARAAYRIDSLNTKSFKLYKELISILDEEGVVETDIESIYISIWFAEAYWKIGTLYMDYGNFSDAIYEIQRALISFYGRGSTQLFEQIYSFLAKSYFKIEWYNEAQCFAKVALHLNPENEFVKPYMYK